MNGKTLLIFIISVAIFTLAATYRFHDSAHAMGVIKKGGGTARHPALLDKDRDSYILIATAGVVPPYHGNARVVIEGDQSLTATFHNSTPVLDLGIHRHPGFRNNTYYDLRPGDRIALWVKINRNRSLQDRKQNAIAMNQERLRGALPACTQCDPENRGTDTVASESGNSGRPLAESEGKPAESSKTIEHGAAWKDKGQASEAGSGSKWRGKGSGEKRAKGPAVSFYDAATNEQLLRIPIRFTGGTGGDDNDH